MLFHNTREGEFHNGPEKGCPKCSRTQASLQARKARGHKGGVIAAAKKPPKKARTCPQCGGPISNGTQTNLCKTCWIASIRKPAQEQRYCADCGKPIGPSGEGRCLICTRKVPEKAQRRDELYRVARGLWATRTTSED